MEGLAELPFWTVVRSNAVLHVFTPRGTTTCSSAEVYFAIPIYCLCPSSPVRGVGFFCFVCVGCAASHLYLTWDIDLLD